jgi:hypothetical protein
MSSEFLYGWITADSTDTIGRMVARLEEIWGGYADTWVTPEYIGVQQVDGVGPCHYFQTIGTTKT